MEFAPLISFNWTLLMQLVTVFVLYIILRKFFFEKVHDFVQKRESTVKEAFDSAEATNRKADEKLEAYSIKIAQIESEGREIIRESKLKADEKAKEIIDEANTKANEIMMRAEKEIKRQKEKALVEMKEEVGMLAVMAAEKIMEKDLEKTDEQKQIVEKIIKGAGTSEWQN